MKIRFKITRQLLKSVRQDLARQHPFAYERVGFIACGVSATVGDLSVYARAYRPVADDDYLRDNSVGAMMGPEAIRKALQWAMSGVSIFHVHTHCGQGHPGFSKVDLREQAKFVPNFFQVAPRFPHGALVLSHTHARGHIWLGADQPGRIINEFVEVGTPLKGWQTR